MPLDLDSPRWETLNHAYGPANDLPSWLRSEAEVLRPSETRSLIAYLCHQGDVHDASYAAFPHLLRIQGSASDPAWKLIALIAGIEISRLSNRGPAIPPDIRDSYFSALACVPQVLVRFLRSGIDDLSLRAILAALAAATGDWRLGDAVLNLSSEVVRQLNDGEL